MLKNIFKEWGRVCYDAITNLEGTILDAWPCDIPYVKEWKTLMDLYKWAI